MNYNPFDEPDNIARKAFRVALLVAVFIACMVVW